MVQGRLSQNVFYWTRATSRSMAERVLSLSKILVQIAVKVRQKHSERLQFPARRRSTEGQQCHNWIWWTCSVNYNMKQWSDVTHTCDGSQSTSSECWGVDDLLYFSANWRCFTFIPKVFLTVKSWFCQSKKFNFELFFFLLSEQPVVLGCTTTMVRELWA